MSKRDVPVACLSSSAEWGEYVKKRLFVVSALCARRQPPFLLPKRARNDRSASQRERKTPARNPVTDDEKRAWDGCDREGSPKRHRNRSVCNRRREGQAPPLLASFRRDEKMGITWTSITSHQTKKREDVAVIRHASAQQAIMEKILPLTSLSPGECTLRMRISDENSGQTVVSTAPFRVNW